MLLVIDFGLPDSLGMSNGALIGDRCCYSNDCALADSKQTVLQTEYRLNPLVSLSRSSLNVKEL